MANLATESCCSPLQFPDGVPSRTWQPPKSCSSWICGSRMPRHSVTGPSRGSSQCFGGIDLLDAFCFKVDGSTTFQLPSVHIHLLFQGGWLNYISTTIRAYPSDGANPRITHTIPHNLGGLLGKLRSGLNQTMLITIRKRGDVIHKHYSHYSKHQCPMTKAPQTHNLSQSGYSMYNDLTATWLGNCLD